MTDLSSLTALGRSTPQTETFGFLTLQENASLALASLALRRGAAKPAPFGLQLPEPGRCTAGEGYAAYWTGPGQWMVEAQGQAEEDFAREVRAQAPGASVTEQTDGWIVFEIVSSAGAGPLKAFMRKLVNLDADGFEPGHATRTGLEHMSVFVIRRAEDRLAVIGMRSAAGSLWHAMTAAAVRLEVAA